MKGRWKARLAWGVMAMAGLIYLASLLPVVAALEEGGADVSDQPPSLVSGPVSMITSGTGEPEIDATITDSEESIAEIETTSDPQPSDLAPAASPGVEDMSTPEPSPAGEISADAGETAPADSGETASTDTEAPGTVNSADPAQEVIEPAEPSPEEQLAGFINSRLGLVPFAATAFPIHNVDTTGEYVFQTPAIFGSHFSAIKHRPIPESAEIPACYSALISYGEGTMSGFQLYKNMRHDPLYDDCYIAMSTDGQVLFNGLTMEVTELYAHELIGVRIFPLLDFWTTNPGEDLPLGVGEVPPAPDAEFRGDDFKVTVIKMTADYIEIPNFSLSVRPGRT